MGNNGHNGVPAGFWWRMALARVDGRKGYIIGFDYDGDLVERLKSTISPALREYHPDNKTWWIDARCELQIDRLFPGFLVGATATRPFPGFGPDEEFEEGDLWT